MTVPFTDKEKEQIATVLRAICESCAMVADKIAQDADDAARDAQTPISRYGATCRKQAALKIAVAIRWLAQVEGGE